MRLQRDVIHEAFQRAVQQPGEERNLGLLFARGLPEWPDDDATKRGEAFAQFIRHLTAQQAPASYRLAYGRWKALTADPLRAAQWEGTLDTRLFIGLGAPHALETCLSFSRPWGLPLLPGSALKGLARAHAERRGIDAAVVETLFGRAPQGDGDNGEGGYLVFHDAWWMPNSAATPLAAEVVTVHHANYYGSFGDSAATDFDSPNPNAQLAARGGFLFVIEGDGGWADYAMQLLREALAWSGAGGKTAAGYGYFGALDAGAGNTGTKVTQGRETWKNATLAWDAGSSTLEAHNAEKERKARLSGKPAKALYDSLSNQQRKQRQLRLDVIVQREGNQAQIVEFVKPGS